MRPPTIVSQALQTAGGMAALHGFAFLTSILIARGLGPAAQGRFQVVLSIAVFVTLITTGGLDEAVAYLLPRYRVEQPEKTNAFTFYALAVTAFAAVLTGVLFYLNAGVVERLLRIAGIAYDIRFLLLLCPSLMVLSMSLAILRGFGRSDWRAYINYYLVGGSYLVAVALLFTAAGLTSGAAYMARISSITIGAVIALWLIFRHPSPGRRRVHLGRSDLRNIHTFGGWLVFVGMFQYAIEQPLLDLIIVGRSDTASAVGLYSVAAKAAGVIATGSLALNVVMAPVFSRIATERDIASLRAAYRRASIWIAVSSAALGLGVLFFRREILLLFGRAYNGAEGILVMFAVAQIVAGLFGLNTPLLIATGRARIEFAITAVGAMILLVVGIAIGAKFGAIGVAVVSAGTTAGVALARRIAVSRVMTLDWLSV